MIRKMLSIDLVPSERRAIENGFPYFPLKEFIQFVGAEGRVDVIETYVTLQRRVPEDNSAEAIAQVEQQTQRKRYALEMSGGRVIECPSKRSLNSGTGYKQSDDQRLMIKTMVQAMKFRPDFLVLVAADGDYAPMAEALRDEGIRTEVIAASNTLASDLQRVAYLVTDLDEVLQHIKSMPKAPAFSSNV
jgi:hypothetical protein